MLLILSDDIVMVQTGGRDQNHWRTHFYLGISSILPFFDFFAIEFPLFQTEKYQV